MTSFNLKKFYWKGFLITGSSQTMSLEISGSTGVPCRTTQSQSLHPAFSQAALFVSVYIIEFTQNNFFNRMVLLFEKNICGGIRSLIYSKCLIFTKYYRSPKFTKPISCRPGMGFRVLTEARVLSFSIPRVQENYINF